MHSFHFDEFRDKKVRRFRQFSLESHVLQRCENWKPKIPSSICRSVSSASCANTLRIIVPYNRYIFKGITGVRNQIQENLNVLLRGVLSRLKVAISFKHASEQLHITLRRLNRAWDWLDGWVRWRLVLFS